MLELLEPDVVGAREPYEGIFEAGFYDPDLAEDFVAFGDPKLLRLRRGDAEEREQGQMS